MNTQLSRRNFLKGFSAAALLGLTMGPSKLVQAQISPPSGDLFGIYRFAVGDMQITVIKDGVSPLNPDFLSMPENLEAVREELAAANLPTDELLSTINIMVIQSGDEIYLVDAGLGVAVIPTLALINIAPEDITGILGTHWHPDHVAGLSNNGVVNFPNATFYLSQIEFDFIQANAETFVADAAAAIAPYASSDRLSLYNPEDEIVSGIQAVAALGHTPGHHALLLSSGENQLLSLIDTAINASVHVPNPSFAFQFDADPVMAADSRVELLSRAAAEQIPVLGYHFPFPGVGYIADGLGDDQFRFVPYS